MLTEIQRKGLAVALVILGWCLAAGDLSAQNPGAPTPTPLPIPTTRQFPAPQPKAKQPVAEPARIDPRSFSPDLELMLDPRSASAAPTTFTVLNGGLGAATEASLLRVTVRLLPLDVTSRYGRPVTIDTFAGPITVYIELTDEVVGEICSLPYPDFQAAIGPLGPGDSEVVSESGTRRMDGVMDVGLIGARAATRTPTHSYVRQIEMRLVCVYELRATVDANRDVAESNESNNETVHIFQREVTLR